MYGIVTFRFVARVVSPPPAMMNGYQVETNVLSDIVYVQEVVDDIRKSCDHCTETKTSFLASFVDHAIMTCASTIYPLIMGLLLRRLYILSGVINACLVLLF